MGRLPKLKTYKKFTKRLAQVSSEGFTPDMRKNASVKMLSNKKQDWKVESFLADQG